MKVCVVCIGPPRGAIAFNALEFVSMLSAKHSVSVIAPDTYSIPNSETIQHLKLAYSRPHIGFFFDKTNTAISSNLRCGEFDAVFVVSTTPFNFPFVWALRRSNIVFWWHEPVDIVRLGLVRACWNGVSDFLMFALSRRVIVAGAHLCVHLPRKFKNRVSIIPLPDLRGFPAFPKKNAAPIQLKIVFFGMIEPYKGLEFFSQVLLSVLASGRRLLFHVLGSGDIPAAVPTLAKLALAYPDNIRIINSFVENDVIAKAISDSSIVVMPYQSATGSNNVAVTFARETPILASKVGYLAESIENGVNGWTLDYGDHEGWKDRLISLMDMPQQIADCAVGARTTYQEKFESSKIGEKLEAALGLSVA